MLKRYTALVTVLFLLIGTHTHADDKRIVIISAGYNNKHYYKKMLDSVFNQSYKNWHLMYTDDCSSDGTGGLVEEYINQKGFDNKVTLIQNPTRLGSAIANQDSMIHRCANSDIIVILDADDWFANANVLTYLNQVYADPAVWLTYGQFLDYPSGAKGFCCPMPAHVVKRNTFRQFPHLPSHLRTFYAGLFKRIHKEDLMLDGEFLCMTGDLAAMMPMIEMARDGHFRFIPHVLLIHNEENPLNDHKKSKALQRKIDLTIRSRPAYPTIESPF